jgi:hypothetical protein
MAQTRSSYADKLVLTCIENGKTMDAEILDFTPAYMLTCSVNRQVKVYLRYNNTSKNYVGKVGSLEFTTTGPKETITTQGKRG